MPRASGTLCRSIYRRGERPKSIAGSCPRPWWSEHRECPFEGAPSFLGFSKGFHETKYVRIVADKSAAPPAEIPADRLSFRLAQLEAAKGPHEIGDGRADLS